MSKNLTMSVEYLLRELSECPNLNKRKTMFNSFLLLINSGINPGFPGEIVQISKEDFAYIDSDWELLKKMKEVFDLLLTDEQKLKKPKMPLLSKIFRCPYARKVSSAAALVIYYSETTNSYKLILQENKRRKGVFCYASAGFEESTFTNPKGEILEDRSTDTKLPDDIDAKIYNSTPYSGKFDVADFNAAAVKALETIGYFNSKFKWTPASLSEYRNLTIKNLLTLKDSSGKDKYTQKDLNWINYVDLNPFCNLFRELKEETGIDSNLISILMPLTIIDSAGSLGSFIDARNEVVQYVSTYGIFIGKMTDKQVAELLNPGSDCSRLFIIDMQDTDIEKNSDGIEVLDIKNAIVIRKNDDKIKEQSIQNIKMALGTYKFLSVHIKEFYRKLGNVIIKSFANELHNDQLSVMKDKFSDESYSKFAAIISDDLKMRTAITKSLCKKFMSCNAEDIILLNKRLDAINQSFQKEDFRKSISNLVEKLISTSEYKELEKFTQNLDKQSSKQALGFF